MSNAGATLILVVVMFGLAIYFVFVPPPGFDGSFLHRVTIPFLLVACALSIFENLRTRMHMSQLIGALRQIMGRTGAPPTPEGRREAVEILIRSLKADQEHVRNTAAEQLKRLTGQDLGADPAAWERWWSQNKGNFS